MHACNGVLYNHESPRRGHEFVTRKITRAAARIKFGLTDRVPLGNLEAKRDWGHAREYVKAMWLMLQQPVPEDYVVASGETHSVRELADLAFSRVGLEYQKYVVLDEKLFRPAEVDVLLGDPSLARQKLGWKYDLAFSELVYEMVDSDVRSLVDGRLQERTAFACH
jgi:GDPmannose 4,6-dehydratase